MATAEEGQGGIEYEVTRKIVTVLQPMYTC